LLILSFRVNNDPSLQDELIKQADQNEIANTSTTPSNTTATPAQPVITSVAQPTVSTEAQQTTTVQQPTNEVQP